MGALVVVRAGRTEISALQTAVQQLATVGARVLGSVLNDPDAEVPKYARYYGYYYATELFDLVPESVRRRHAARIAAVLVPLQEDDGSFWDYQLYGYHKTYGTAFVLLALARCRSELP